MKIYSMTATFGKLNHETLTLQPGLNVLEAPNEWGKSTWCAFILAMLYGIDTSSRSKKDFLADKERYAPWSGAPMSGRMDICWNGRDITIERTTKGRSILGQFKAYETGSGLEVAELTAANCGQQLLGVEQSVLARAGFVRLRDMPVTQDESLRRRLNSLVTTGDESGSADDLAQKLRDLKNRCRFNRSGLLPQAEAQKTELSGRLEELENLQRQASAIEKRQAELKSYQAALSNHRQALQYEENKNFAGKVAMARAQLEVARERTEALDSVCRCLPDPKTLEMKKFQLQQMQEQKEALQMQIQLQPPAPLRPEPIPQFRGMDPATAVEQTRTDRQEFRQLCDGVKPARPVLWIIGLVLLLAGAVLTVLTGTAYALLPGVAVTLLGVLLQVSRSSRNKELQQQIRMLARKYAPIEPDDWEAEAKQYADSQRTFDRELAEYQRNLQEQNARLREILNRLDTVTEGQSVQRYEQELSAAMQQHRAYADALRECSRLEETVATLEGTHRQTQPPQMPDELTFTMPETERILSDVTAEIRHLHQRLGQCQGRMETLGDQNVIRQQLDKTQIRIAELEKVHDAAVFAQETVLRAKQELQRRFSPRISQRAQQLFAQMTDGRYQRITLGEDLSVSTAAEGEDILRGSLWRSDGTADQLYLALRLAVAEELTPEAPLVLDDAFVRFDDKRLKRILEILKQSGEDRQILLFTCQSRERKIMEELS